MNSGQLKRAKRRVRHEVLARRDAIPPDERDRQAELVADRVLAEPEMPAATSVMTFWSFGSELPTMPLIRRLVEAGVRVALPRIVEGDLEAHTWRPGEPTIATTFGAHQPAAGEVLDPKDLDVVVTPAVAFDRGGRRVGYGGGFYDRFLPRTRPDALRLGIAFDVQIVEGDLPSGAFDLRVHAIVTPSQTIRCPREP